MKNEARLEIENQQLRKEVEALKAIVKTYQEHLEIAIKKGTYGLMKSKETL